MNTPWFFLSYARTDSNGHEHLKQFYLDLARELRRIPGLPSDTPNSEVGFLDMAGIETGEHWAEKIASTLNTSRTLLCLYSLGYFNSSFCGKEFGVFRSRVDDYVEKSNPKIERPPSILPVVWDSPARLPKPMPSAVKEIQYKHAEFGEMYANEGLYFIMKIDKYKSEYDEFLLRFAGRIFDAAQNDRLPPLAEPPAFEAFESAFHATPASEAPVTATRNERGGPRVAQFVYVAGRNTEFDGVRQTVDSYGEEGPQWQPYYPEYDRPVGIISQGVATTEGLFYETFPVDKDLLAKLRQAEDKNTIVIIVVDPWSIQVESYQKHMLEFDRKDFLNCGILIPWNEKDEETTVALSKLQTSVQKTFTRKFILNTYFRDSISSADELQREICDTINEVRRRLLLRAKVEQLVESTSHSLPTISGSGLPL